MTEFLEPVYQQILDLDVVLKTSHSVPEIPDLLNRTVLVGGKRLRPALAFLMGQALGVDSQKMTYFARAAEFTHSASLAHDDVVDNAYMRRNVKTINAESSNKRAVLAGDLLLARVMVELSEQGNVDIIHDLALAVEDLVNGEWLQMAIRGRTDVTQEELIEVSLRKTASLMSWCCVVAARLSPHDSADLRALASDFGKNLGIAFQMVDDIIDFDKSGEKTFAKDLREGIMNYVACDMVSHSPDLKQGLQAILGTDFQDVPWTDEELQTSLDNIRKISGEYLNKAREKLHFIKKLSPPKDDQAHKSYAALEGLLNFLNQRDA